MIPRKVFLALNGYDEDYWITYSDIDICIRARLAGYKTPKRFVMRDTLERSPAGKADYKLLRAVAAEATSE